MPKLTIDDMEVMVEPGTSIIQAANVVVLGYVSLRNTSPQLFAEGMA